MVDIVSKSERSRMMSGIRSKNTGPEVVVRKMLHAEGYRFRLHRKDLPGSPDIVLPKYRSVVFVNGCFWHGHGDCHLYRLPKSNTRFWQEKIISNCARDEINYERLVSLGWNVVIVWECAVKGKCKMEKASLGALIREALDSEIKNITTIRGRIF